MKKKKSKYRIRNSIHLKVCKRIKLRKKLYIFSHLKVCK
ncbi:hypothetical protein E2C01_065260 [Portunus trituberculatus]|uniref:Uncharacterized protein n=1 Tax=Portunus trituberculatus TaxID=210409 RepID=A0A5B7HLE9_PORTR|nr:hypothetical protein [Portunus trituberculatus]